MYRIYIEFLHNIIIEWIQWEDPRSIEKGRKAIGIRDNPGWIKWTWLHWLHPNHLASRRRHFAGEGVMLHIHVSFVFRFIDRSQYVLSWRDSHMEMTYVLLIYVYIDWWLELITNSIEKSMAELRFHLVAWHLVLRHAVASNSCDPQSATIQATM